MILLELGSGACPTMREGARVVHLDRVGGPHVELVADLNHGIPIPSNAIDEVLAIDVLEHLQDFVHAMDEIHRVLVPGGLAVIQVPLAGTYNHTTDPTHVRGFSLDSLDFFSDDLPLGKHNGRLYTPRRWTIERKEQVGLNLKAWLRAKKPDEAPVAWGL